MVQGQLLPRKITPKPQKLTLTQTLTLAGRQCSSGQLSGCTPNLKVTLTLTETLTLTGVAIFLGGTILRIPL